MKKTSLIIATRNSPLALWQANWVKTQLIAIYPHLSVELLGLATKADMLLSTPLYKVGGKGLFVKELEEAILTQRADIAVHSMKDVPMQLPTDLCVPVMCEREDPLDVLVTPFDSLSQLPPGAIIGTSSLRRQSQLLVLRPDIKVVFLRGNVHTRLAKLDQGEYSAIILAAAGLKRLNLTDRIRDYLSIEEMLPAAGQGVLGIECRVNDIETQQLIAPLNHAQSNICVTAERAMCRYLGGGCHAPIAAYAEIIQEQLCLRGMVATPDGKIILSACYASAIQDAENLGTRTAKDLLQQGAQKILDSLVC